MDLFSYCIKCSKRLTNDEIGLHKKLVSRAATEYMCMHCLCEYFSMSEDSAKRLIERYRKSGCTLFSSAPGTDGQEN